MKRKLSFLAGCLLLSSVPVSSQTLEQAVAIALATNPEIKSSYNQYVSTVKESDASGGKYLPTIDLDAGIGYEGIRPASTTGREDTDLTRKEASIILNQLLWDPVFFLCSSFFLSFLSFSSSSSSSSFPCLVLLSLTDSF